MTHFFKKILYLPIIFVFLITSTYADITIRVMPNTGSSELSNQPTKATIQSITKQALAREHVNISNNSRYKFIAVKFIQTESERYLLVHLMSRYYFSYRIIRINLNLDNSIKYPIIKNYHLQPADFSAQSNNIASVASACPAQYQTGKPLFVIGTPYYTDFVSATRSVDALSQAVSNTQQYQLVKLLDNNATIQNYQNILTCPNLKYFFHIGHSTIDGDGQAFVLHDGDFDATYFSQNPQLNLNNKTITLDSCELFDQVNKGFCPILSKMSNAPLVYSSGSSELLVYGSPETYACFWEAILQGQSLTQSTLAQCALLHDPSMRNSQSGVYLLAGDTPLYVQTNQRLITIQPSDGYTILKLHNGEMITQYAIKNNEQMIACTPDPTNRITLLNNAELTAGEFILNDSDSNTCQFSEISRMQRTGGLSRDIYGFYPAQSCFNLPDKSLVGLTLFSMPGNDADLICNGISFSGIINPFGMHFDWQDAISQFHGNDLDCIVNADTTKTEIASMHVNIRPSSTSPEKLSGQVSNLKSMNGYPLPSITYSAKGDGQGYYNGIAIVINSK